MKHITISNKALYVVEKYTRNYRLYHQTLFEDSGIWQEQKIIQIYQQESIKRYNEILDLITKSLSNSIVSYKNNRAIFRWKTKTLIVNFEDQGEIRTILDLEIR